MDKLTRRLARRVKRAAAIHTAAASYALESFEARLLLSTVMTDKQDYGFGDTAMITGSGFAAGEQVQLQVQNAPGYGSNDDAQNQPWTVNADDAGKIASSWVVDDPDAVNALYILSARGLTSGELASTTFTDSINGLSNLQVGAQSIVVNAGTGASPTFAVTVDRNGGGDPITYSILNPTTVFPSGVTFSFSPNGTMNLTATTLAITTQPGTPAGSYPFTVRATGNSHTTDGQGTLKVGTPTTTTLTSSGVSTYGNTVTFQATVSGGTTPSGSVQFKDGAANLGSPVTLNGAGIATLNTSSLSASASPHSISAVYIPDTTHNASTSNSVSQTVNKAGLTVTANDKSKTYGAVNPTFDGTLTGVISGDGITASYSSSATQFSDAGTYTITAGLNDPGGKLGNYNVTNTSGTFTVNKADQTITWNDPAAITYGTTLGAAQLNATAAGVPGGSAAGTLTYTPGSGTLLNAGSGQMLSVTAAATTNYNVATKSVTIDVNKANQTITWNNPTPIAYGTALSGTQLNATVAGVAGGSAPGGLTYTPAAGTVLNAGNGQTLSVTATGTANYNATTKNVSINVIKANLTVTANNKTKTYGDPNPSFDGTLTGVVPGDGITATFSTTAGQFSDVGSYTITATLNDPNSRLSNYTIANNSGTLTINKADQTITWANPADITYGTALDGTQLNASVAGIMGGSAPGALTYTPATGTVLNAGAGQTLSVSAAGTTNYNPAAANVTINVSQAALFVTADDKVRAKGAADPATSYTVNGLVNGDSTTGTPTVTMPTVGAAQVGVFPISIAAGTFNAGSNYAVTFVPGKLTVTGVQINDGEAQRSMIRSIKVTFASPTAGTPTLTLTRRGGGSVSPTGSTTSDDGKTITYTFATGASPTLIDGIYDLSATDGSQSQSLTFHRLFGDSNGDKKVDAADLAAVALSTRPGATYVWYFDFDGLNGDDTGDYNQAKARLGHTFAY